MLKVRKNDIVFVSKGKDRGKIGKVLKVIIFINKGKVVRKLVVEGLNFVKKCFKSDPSTNAQGSIVEKEMPIAYANVILLNSEKKNIGKVGFIFTKNGEKVRIFKKTKGIFI